MPQNIDSAQRLTLACRENFIGRPTGDGASWTYRGREYTVDRPRDGEQPAQWKVTCPGCGKRLSFTVYGVAATRRRQSVRRAIAWTGLAVLLLSLLGCFAAGGGALAIFIPGAIAGAAIGYYVGGVASDEMGISGHGAAMPLVQKHAITLLPPSLICERCGHREAPPAMNHMRRSWQEKQLQEAASRFASHHCTP